MTPGRPLMKFILSGIAKRDIFAVMAQKWLLELDICTTLNSHGRTDLDAMVVERVRPTTT